MRTRDEISDKSIDVSDDAAFDDVFTEDGQVVHDGHGYPWLIHHLVFHCMNHDDIHLCGSQEDGNIGIDFEMTVHDNLDHSRLMMDTILGVPQAAGKGTALKRQIWVKPTRHESGVDKHSQELRKNPNLKWRS